MNLRGNGKEHEFLRPEKEGLFQEKIQGYPVSGWQAICLYYGER